MQRRSGGNILIESLRVHGVRKKRRVRSPSEMVSPSLTTCTVSGGIWSRDTRRSRHFSFVTTFAMAYISRTMGSDPEWSCSAWLMTM